jgi:hypothetical protein
MLKGLAKKQKNRRKVSIDAEEWALIIGKVETLAKSAAELAAPPVRPQEVLNAAVALGQLIAEIDKALRD